MSLTSGRIGLFGGTFNPIHHGHLVLAQSAFESYDLDRVIFIPCRQPPHKDNSPLAAADHRLAMLDMAIEGDIRFGISRVELEREGPSYTIDTVKWFAKKCPDKELFFIIGADTLPELHMWKDIEELLGMCRFISFERPGMDRENLKPERIQLPEPWPGKLLEDLSKGLRFEVSSSELRYRIAEGFSIRYLVPQQVEMYIAEHSLYKA